MAKKHKVNKQKGIKALAEALAPSRQALIEALKYADDQPEFQFIIRALADPRNAKKSIERVCKDCEVSYFKFMRLVSDSKRASAILDAMDSISKKVPILADDIMENALNKLVDCNACDGAGMIKPTIIQGAGSTETPPAPTMCKRCAGSGKILLMADIDRQKLAADIGGLIKKGPGVNVNVSNNNSNELPTNTPEFRSNTDKWLDESIPAQLVEKN